MTKGRLGMVKQSMRGFAKKVYSTNPKFALSNFELPLTFCGTRLAIREDLNILN